MRRNLLHFGYKELSYEIREIVEIANKVEAAWTPISWENIWDPIQKWETFPAWGKELIIKALEDESVFWYSPSKGLLKTREYLANKNGKITADDIIFFNGLWEAINKTYGYLAYSARVLGPNPAYPTHSSAEATNSGSEHLTYNLDPYNDWNPDLEEIENKVKYNPNVTAILVINPDNPTGAIFKRDILEGIVDIAKRYDLFLIFDEIYEKLVYNPEERVSLSEIIGDVPGISMKWISKDFPWPGARCGWIEVYNRDKDENFKKYIQSVYASKMLEVCSTTLPQYMVPLIYEDPRYKVYLQERIEKYKKRAEIVKEYLSDIDGVTYIAPKWAFYFTVVFDIKNVNTQYMPRIENPEIEKLVHKIIDGKRWDKRFCYSLLACTWICIVPLSWFNSSYEWFRMTLLENNEEKFRLTLKTMRQFIYTFLDV
jgi:alanine-synthesizing transaminase